MPKVGFVSLGCPKNLVDSEVMMGILTRAGYEITPRAGDADVLVVNTCSFIAPAQQESVQSILEMAEYKKFGRAQKLIVAGCMVERYRNDIREQIPEVDAVIGTGEVEKILEACEGQLQPTGSDGASLPSYLYHDLTPRILSTPRHTAYIKINEGCDHPCTFCVIPQLRGKFRSRRFESVVREAENLAAAGVREISLIGQDTTFYGEDLGLREGLPILLERLAQIQLRRQPFERACQRIDLVLGPVRQVGQGAVLHLAALAVALPQQDGRRRASVGDDSHIHAP